MKTLFVPVPSVKSKLPLLATLALILALAFVLIPAARTQAAACQQPSADYGTATMTVSIPETATYRIWTFMQVPDTNNNTYLLEVDGNNCYTVGGAMPANAWTWIAHQSGNTNNKVDISLSKGTHTLKLIGRQPNVKINRLVFTSDLGCVPSGNGSNCDKPDDTATPTVSLNTPAADAVVSGTAKVTASANDNVGVAKVEFYVNSALRSTDTSTPYEYNWDTTIVPNGQQLLTVKAYDATGNVASDSVRVTVQNGDTQAPTTPGDVAAAATAYNRVTLSWKTSVDDTGIKSYRIIRNGVFLNEVGAVTNYEDTTVAPNTEYRYRVTAVDLAGNKSAASAEVKVKTPSVTDTQAPSAPSQLAAQAVSASQINLKWQASTDNIGVTGYDVYRGSQKIATVATTSFGDTGLKANKRYTYSVRAKDAAGNVSTPSDSASSTTLKKSENRKVTIRGKVTDSANQRPLRWALVEVNVSGKRHFSLTNRKGNYTIRKLEPGNYNVTYRAFRHESKSERITVTGDDNQALKNVSLQRKTRNR